MTISDRDRTAAPGLPRRARLLLRVEAAAATVAILVAYGALGGSWWLLAALWLVPDLSALGYLAGPRVGALAYNVAHTTLGPVALGLLAWGTGGALLGHIALIWLSHIAIDRALGYGLKLGGFRDTHLS